MVSTQGLHLMCPSSSWALERCWQWRCATVGELGEGEGHLCSWGFRTRQGCQGFGWQKQKQGVKKKNHRIIAFMCSAWLPPALCHLTPCGRLFACPSFVVSLFCSPSSGRICHSILCHRSLLSSSRLPHGSIILGQFYPVLGNLLHPPISMNPSIPGAVLLLSS